MATISAGVASVTFLHHQRIEQGLHGVEIALRDRIVHVIVALGAADGQAHERGGHRLDGRDRQLLAILAVADDGAAREEAEREQVVRPRLDAARGRRWPTSGSGSLTDSRSTGCARTGRRQIVVEGVDHPIAPEIDAGRGDHPLVDVGVAQHVEPVPAIADAVLLAGEQAIDHLFVGVRRRVLEERFLLGGRRRQADEVEMTRAAAASACRPARPAFRPFALYSAAMNASIGLGDVVRPAGTSGRTTGFKTHNSGALAVGWRSRRKRRETPSSPRFRPCSAPPDLWSICDTLNDNTRSGEDSLTTSP